jgi:hypothetical protein
MFFHPMKYINKMKYIDVYLCEGLYERNQFAN